MLSAMARVLSKTSANNSDGKLCINGQWLKALMAVLGTPLRASRKPITLSDFVGIS